MVSYSRRAITSGFNYGKPRKELPPVRSVNCVTKTPGNDDILSNKRKPVTSDMKVPARPAPLPPTGSRTQSLHSSTGALDDWEDRNDPFSRQICPPRPLSAQLGHPGGGKKKPPPRPPPPKLAQKNGRKQQVPARPSNLLSGLFSRASRNQQQQQQLQQQQQQQKALPPQRNKKDHPAPPAPVAVASLIDFDSPSSSPTPTTHSSSDGLSINSFGSDGSASVSRQTPVGMGSSSMFESGFEDDFDFFGSLSNSSSFGVTPISEEKDPWSPVQPQDPFSPPRQNTNNLFDSLLEKQTGNSLFYGVSKPVEVTKPSAMPTIIRAKPARPPAPTPAPAKTNISLFPVSTSEDNSSAPVISNGIYVEEEEEVEEEDDERGNWSPPMPSIPPPPLPPEVYAELDEDSSQQQNSDTEPYGIAIYDYVATHQDDLSFKVNDVIQLLHEINSEWLYGRVGNHEGMFPANFVNVVVPLSSNREPQEHIVKAVYTFAAETWDDLTFKEGDTVRVISRVNKDWLYGKCGDRSGQFPAAFVDHVPSNLPLHRA